MQRPVFLLFTGTIAFFMKSFPWGLAGMVPGRTLQACSNTPLKILSWNVAGLRAMLTRDEGAELTAVLLSEQPDITFIQEHKLQDTHVSKAEPNLLRMFTRICGGEHCAAWAVSTSHKG
ncbi:DNA-(apurinic or apyrimidinic site) endonuclease, partial [Durusdinium trenchii]